MADTEPRRPPVAVGVLLPPPPPDLGGWLADAAAFDAAGAHSLWIDTPGADWLDPLAVTAALTSITFRSLLVTAAPEAADDRTLATIERLSRGRFALHGDRVPPPAPPEVAVFRPVGDGGYVCETASGEPQRWVRIGWAGGRAAWRATIAEAAEGGATGVLVPAQPPLLDILRNPGGAADRTDLQLAQG